MITKTNNHNIKSNIDKHNNSNNKTNDDNNTNNTADNKKNYQTHPDLTIIMFNI